MKTTATKLRADLYKVLDRIADTGETVEIERRGKLLKIVREEEAKEEGTPYWRQVLDKVRTLKPHPDYIIGNPDELVDIDWSKDWKPYFPSTHTSSRGSGSEKKRRSKKSSKTSGPRGSRSRPS